MRRNRGALYVVVLVAAGVLLIVGGGYLYQYSVASAEQFNNNCPYGTGCAFAEPNPLGLWLADAGWVLLVASVPSAALVYWTAFRTHGPT